MSMMVGVLVESTRKFKSAAEYIRAATILRIDGDYASSAECFDASTKLTGKSRPKDTELVEAYIGKAGVLRALNDNDGAISAAQAALKINTQSLKALYNLTRAQYINYPDTPNAEAQAAMDRIKVTKPITLDDYEAVGFAHWLSGDHNTGIQVFQAAALLFSKNPFIHYDLADLFKKDQKYHEAELELREAARLDKTFFSAWFELGDVLLLQRDFKGSEKALKEAHKLNPDNLEASLALIDVLYQQANYKGILELTQKELLIHPEAADIHTWSGVALLELGNIDIAAKKEKAANVKFNDAEGAFKDALKLSPDSVLYHCNYARLLHALGRDKEAVAEFNAAYTLYQTHKDDQGLHSGNHAFLEQVFASERAPLLEKMTALAEVDLAPIELVGDATKASKKAPDTIDARWSKQIADKNAEAAHKAQEKQSLMDDAVAVFGQKSAYAADHHAGAAGAASPSLVEMMQHMEKMMASVSALRHELDDMRALQTARQDIAKDHAANEYYHGFVGKLSETFTTSQAVKSGALSLDTDSIVASAVSGALSFLPGGGVAGKLVEAGAKLAKTMDITSKARKFSDVAANHTEFDQIVMHLATEAILAPKMHARIHAHKAEATVTSWFEGIIVSAKKLAAKFDEKMFGKQFATAEAKMGYHDASYLIDLITSDAFTITHNHAELHQKLTTAMLGEEGHHALFEF